MKKKYNESAEDYLETILMLSKTLPVVRAVDIATELDFKKSSVSVAMKNSDKKKILEHLSRQNFADGPSAAFFTDSAGAGYIVKVKRVFGVR